MATAKVGIDSRGAKRGANDAVKSLDRIRKAARRLNKDGLKTVGDGFSKLRRSVFNLKSAIAGVGIGLLTRSFVQAASVTENYRVRLEALTGSMHEANKVFQDMSKFAGEVPFQYEQIMNSAVTLIGVLEGGREEVGQFMPIIADLAAVSGLTIQQTTEQVVRMYSAGAASADLFRERGILAMLGFQAGVSVSADETRKRLIEAWEDPESKFRGVTERLAETWDGILSMLGDRWFMFRNMVMENDAFTLLKERATDFLAAIDQAMASGRMDVWAKNLANVFMAGLDAIVAIGKSVGWLFNLIATNINNGRILFASFVANIMKGWEMIKLGGSGIWLLVRKGFELAVTGMQELWLTFVEDVAASMRMLPLGMGDALAASMQSYVDSTRAARGEAMDLQAEMDILSQKHLSAVAGIDAMTQSVIDQVTELEKLRVKQSEIQPPGADEGTGRTGMTPSEKKAMEESLAAKAQAWDIEQARAVEAGERLIAQQQERLAKEKALLEESVAAKAAAWDIEQANAIAAGQAQIEIDNKVREAKARNAALNEQAAIDGLKIGLNLFAKGKQLAIGKAIIGTYQGAAQAMRDVPYPWNIAAAALVITEGLKSVQKIKSTSARGGGGGGGGRGGGRGSTSLSAGGGGTTGGGSLTQPGGAGTARPTEIRVTINALDPESIDPANLQEIIRKGFPEAMKSGGGVFDDVEIPFIQR